MVKNGCDQSGLKDLKLTVSQEWIDGMNWFFACWCKFMKVISMIFGWAWSKIGLANLFMRQKNLLYRKNESMNWTDFLHGDCDVIFFG